jgi:hypothetical protein
VHRPLGIALSATLLLAACKIEPTPRQFYSQRDPAATERELFAAELTDRVTAMGPALGRGDTGAAVFALAPAPEVYTIGPDGGSPSEGPEGLAAALGALGDSVPQDFRVQEVRVVLGPRAQTAWFATGVEVSRADTGEEADTLRFTGVYQRARGEWRLVQAHLSHPLTPPAEPAPSPGDSAPPAGAAPASPPPT